MWKDLIKVNMKLLYITIVAAFLLFISPKGILAQPDVLENPDRYYIDRGDGYGVNPGDKKKPADEVFQDFLSIFFKSRPLPTVSPNGSSTVNPTSVPNVSGTPTNGSVVSPGQTVPVSGGSYKGNFVVYRQCNYRNVETVPGCNLCGMGCGITSAAMVIATLVDPSVEPVGLLNQYKARGAYMTCAGTDIATPKALMEEYGLQTSNYLFSYSNEEAVSIHAVADDIRPYVKNGWFVFVLTNFAYASKGHFHVITDIDEQNHVTSFDPYYEPPESSIQPINYTNRYPYPVYRAAFAVKRR